MSGYIPEVELPEQTVGKDVVRITVKPIKRRDFMKALGHLQKLQALTEEVAGELGVELKVVVDGKEVANPALQDATKKDPRFIQAMNDVLESLAPVVPEYVTKYEGPKDAKGVEVPLTTVLDSAYFLAVALHIVMGLVNTSSVTEDDSGNSARPLAA
jgi:hypothetical protein